MGVNAVGNDGISSLPSLTAVCALFRSIINDTFSGGGGQIATNDAPFMRPYLNSAIRDLWADLRLVGDRKVVQDNVILSGLPPVANADPTVQVALTYDGFFDGAVWHGQWVLPPDCMNVVKVWQRTSGSNGIFLPVPQIPFGLYGTYQASQMRGYEIRGANEMWMTGAVYPVDLRLRYESLMPDLVTDQTVDFDNTYVPVPDATNALAQKMVALYAQRLSPEQFPLAEAQAAKYTDKLRLESIRNAQTSGYVGLHDY